MPEIINTLFGRSKNATAGSGEEVEPTVTVTLEPTGEAAAAEGVETAPSADDVVESTEGESTDHTPADSDSEDTGSEDTDSEDSDAAAESADVEESDEAATDEDTTTDEGTTEEAATEISDEDGGSTENVEPVAAEADDAPVAAETADDADDAVDVDQTEPVVVPVVAETRPATGDRGSVTVGEGVVAKVVNIVVGKIDGVHSLDDEGTSVEVDGDVATVKVSLVVEYGHAIKALAERIRIDVIEAVEQFLGLDVAAVDVHVSDVHAA